MINQYDKSKAKLLYKLIHGSSRKARDATLASLLELVVSGGMPSALLQKLLGDLRAARAEATTSERCAIDAAIVDILEGILSKGGMQDVVASNPREPSAATSPVERPMSKLSPLYGIGLREACPKVLSLIGSKTPQTPHEIWEQLKAEGWTSAHRDPVHAVNDALRRRAKTHHDVMLVGAGKWGRTDWYTEAELEEIQKSIGGMGGRDRAAHSERTKSGMIVAMERGAKPGQPKKITPEKVGKIEEMIRSGLSVIDIADQIGVAANTIYNHFPRARMRELRAEGAKREKIAPVPSDETRH